MVFPGMKIRQKYFLSKSFFMNVKRQKDVFESQVMVF